MLLDSTGRPVALRLPDHLMVTPSWMFNEFVRAVRPNLEAPSRLYGAGVVLTDDRGNVVDRYVRQVGDTVTVQFPQRYRR